MLCLALELHGVGNILSIIGLSILSIQDIKRGEIHYRYLLLMVDFQYLEGFFLIIIFITFYKYVQNYIGGADLLIFGLLITRYGLYISINIIFYAAFFGLIYSLIKKVSKLKFIPFIFIGFLIVLKGGLWKLEKCQLKQDQEKKP